MFNGFQSYNVAEKIKNFFINLWENRRKQLIIFGGISILLFIILITFFNKRGAIIVEANYQEIENEMLEKAKEYFETKNKVLGINKSYYIFNSEIDVTIDTKLECKEKSGVLVRNESGVIKYYPYLICPNYNSEELANLITRNNKYKDYGTLSGDNPQFLSSNNAYEELGYVVNNKYTVKVIGNTSLSAGYNLIRYNITENNIFVASLERIVIVKMVESEYPVLELVGEETKTMLVGAKYNELGYVAIDKIDGNITNKVKVTGEVDTSKAGTYNILYTVTNSNGLTTTIQRTIIVNKANSSLSLSSKVVKDSNSKATITVTVSGENYKSTQLPNGTTSTDKKITYYVSKNGTYDFIAYDISGNAKVESVKVTVFSSNSNGDNDDTTISIVTGKCAGTYDSVNKILSLKSNMENYQNIEYYEFKSGNSTSGKINKSTYAFSGNYTNGTLTIYDKYGTSKTFICEIKNDASNGGNGNGNGGGNVNLSCADYEDSYPIGGRILRMENVTNLNKYSSSFFNGKIYLQSCKSCSSGTTSNYVPVFPGGATKIGETAITTPSGVSMCIGAYISKTPITWKQYVSYTHWYEMGDYIVHRKFALVVAQMILIQTYAAGTAKYDTTTGTMAMYAYGCCAQTTRDPERTISIQQANGTGNGEFRGSSTKEEWLSELESNNENYGEIKGVVSKNFLGIIQDATLDGKDLYCYNSKKYTDKTCGLIESERSKCKPCEITIKDKYYELYDMYVKGKVLIQSDGSLTGRYAGDAEDRLENAALDSNKDVKTTNPLDILDGLIGYGKDGVVFYFDGQKITTVGVK